MKERRTRERALFGAPFFLSVALHVAGFLVLPASSRKATHRSEDPIELVMLEVVETPKSSRRGQPTEEVPRLGSLGVGHHREAHAPARSDSDRGKGRSISETVSGGIRDPENSNAEEAPFPGSVEPSNGELGLPPRVFRNGDSHLLPRTAALFGGWRVDASDGGASSGSARVGESEREVVQRRVGHILADAKAATQAEVPDGYWSFVRDRMAGRFVPVWSVFDGAKNGVGSGGTGLGTVLPGYLEAAQQYGSGARPAGPAFYDGNPFHLELIALVRVTQRADGSAEGVELVQSSGYRDLDRKAVEAARSAIEDSELGPTPPQGRRTLWAFVARYEVVPPAPGFGCPLDAVWTAHFDKCAWPLKRSATSKVELRGID